MKDLTQLVEYMQSEEYVTACLEHQRRRANRIRILSFITLISLMLACVGFILAVVLR